MRSREEHVHRARIAGKRASAAEKSVELRNQEIPERLVLQMGTENSSRPFWLYDDRIAVLLTGEVTAEFLLGVPASSDSTQKRGAVVLEGGGRSRASGQDHRLLFRHPRLRHNWPGASGLHSDLSRTRTKPCFGWPSAIMSPR
ncbi:hypothetical protein GWK47_045304 [Chionoecetes opilio]|uniref:Uncharacterized protein n=1 Tax=Chionoecetes opilio TaxID=41210 RepID=A0A8J4Y6E7_CHIOP|nr:hypothetical protein GWK47_045304 [Chionoecetes opilio]